MESLASLSRLVPAMGLAQRLRPAQGHGGPGAVAQTPTKGPGAIARAPTPTHQSDERPLDCGQVLGPKPAAMRLEPTGAIVRAGSQLRASGPSAGGGRSGAISLLGIWQNH